MSCVNRYIPIQNTFSGRSCSFRGMFVRVYTVSDQRGHVSSVHLPAGDVLFGLWHGAHLEALRTSGPRAHDGRQSDGARLHIPLLIKLLLENC